MDNTPVEQNINFNPRIERNENGLIKGLEYKYTEDNLIDWRAMIPPKYLYVNPTNKDRMAKKYGKPYGEIDPINDKVEDVDLVQLLAATKYLLKIRGFESVDFEIKNASQEYAAVKCLIRFIPNFESENREVYYSDCACAHFNNTMGFGNKYLLEMATNRSLARCVRSYLGINIVSKEEISGNIDQEQNGKDSTSNLQIEKLSNLMEKKKISFEILKDKLTKEKCFDGVENMTSLDNIPKDKILDLIERLKKYKPE